MSSEKVRQKLFNLPAFAGPDLPEANLEVFGNLKATLEYKFLYS
jgi:hypothetical protein